MQVAVSAAVEFDQPAQAADHMLAAAGVGIVVVEPEDMGISRIDIRRRWASGYIAAIPSGGVGQAVMEPRQQQGHVDIGGIVTETGFALESLAARFVLEQPYRTDPAQPLVSLLAPDRGFLHQRFEIIEAQVFYAVYRCIGEAVLQLDQSQVVTEWRLGIADRSAGRQGLQVFDKALQQRVGTGQAEQ